jgi:hypothetical protein
MQEDAVPKFDVLVRRRVAYDGPGNSKALIPTGRCVAEASHGFVCLTWIDEAAEQNAVLTYSNFEAALDAGAILITDSSQLRQPS